MQRLVFLLGWVFFLSCTNDNEQDFFQIPCDTDNVFYLASDETRSISTIISNKCIGCHTEGNPPSYLSLETYDDLILFPNLDEIINSEINPMPPIGESPLTECEKQQLTNWVNNGLPEYE